jgi:hypothetical protein
LVVIKKKKKKKKKRKKKKKKKKRDPVGEVAIGELLLWPFSSNSWCSKPWIQLSNVIGPLLWVTLPSF